MIAAKWFDEYNPLITLMDASINEISQASAFGPEFTAITELRSEVNEYYLAEV